MAAARGQHTPHPDLTPSRSHGHGPPSRRPNECPFPVDGSEGAWTEGAGGEVMVGIIGLG